MSEPFDLFQWLFKQPLVKFREQDAQLGFSHMPRIEIVLIALALICIGAWWYYRRETRVHSAGRRLALSGLRVTGVSLILLALSGPVLLLHGKDETTGIVAVAVDVSKSMRAADAGEKHNQERLAAAKAQLKVLLDKLSAKDIEVRVFALGNNARLAGEDDLVAGDDNTRIAQGFKDIVQSAGRRSVSQLVYLGDGQETTKGVDPALTASWAHQQRGTTVHAVGFGTKQGGEDVEIVAVHSPRNAERGSLTEVGVVVRRGNIGDPLKVSLFERDKPIKENIDVPTSPDSDLVMVKIPFVPDQIGQRSYSVRIAPLAREGNKENNRSDFQMTVQDTRVEVLIVEGSPRHEFAFIRRAMADNRYIRLVSHLRLGKDHYYNSATDDTMLGKGFPETAEELGRFKAIILSDIEVSNFTAKQLDLIADFVKNRGGGLCMLGGMNSFNLGGYRGTVIEDLLPVSFAGTTDQNPGYDESEFAFEVTKEGLEHEILRLLPDEAENKAQWNTIQSEKSSLLKGYNPLFGAKQLAAVLARGGAPVNGQKPILLAVQSVGAGRTAAFTPASSWRWKMRRPSTDDTFRRFWTQLIRWLAVGSKEMLDIDTDAEVVNPNQPVTITARVLDRAHQPYDRAKVDVTVIGPSFTKDTLSMPWNLKEHGVYQVTFHPTEPGTYKLSVAAEVPGDQQPLVLTKDTSIVSVESSIEFAHPQMDAEALTGIAKAGGGTVDLEGNVQKTAQAIIQADRDRRKELELIEQKELHDAPALLLLIACVWFGEWIIRKRSGLA